MTLAFRIVLLLLLSGLVKATRASDYNDEDYDDEEYDDEEYRDEGDYEDDEDYDYGEEYEEITTVKPKETKTNNLTATLLRNSNMTGESSEGNLMQVTEQSMISNGTIPSDRSNVTVNNISANTDNISINATSPSANMSQISQEEIPWIVNKTMMTTNEIRNETRVTISGNIPVLNVTDVPTSHNTSSLTTTTNGTMSNINGTYIGTIDSSGEKTAMSQTTNITSAETTTATSAPAHVTETDVTANTTNDYSKEDSDETTNSTMIVTPPATTTTTQSTRINATMEMPTVGEYSTNDTHENLTYTRSPIIHHISPFDAVLANLTMSNSVQNASSSENNNATIGGYNTTTSFQVKVPAQTILINRTTMSDGDGSGENTTFLSQPNNNTVDATVEENIVDSDNGENNATNVANMTSSNVANVTAAINETNMHAYTNSTTAPLTSQMPMVEGNNTDFDYGVNNATNVANMTAYNTANMTAMNVTNMSLSTTQMSIIETSTLLGNLSNSSMESTTTYEPRNETVPATLFNMMNNTSNTTQDGHESINSSNLNDTGIDSGSINGSGIVNDNSTVVTVNVTQPPVLSSTIGRKTSEEDVNNSKSITTIATVRANQTSENDEPEKPKKKLSLVKKLMQRVTKIEKGLENNTLESKDDIQKSLKQLPPKLLKSVRRKMKVGVRKGRKKQVKRLKRLLRKARKLTKKLKALLASKVDADPSGPFTM